MVGHMLGHMLSRRFGHQCAHILGQIFGQRLNQIFETAFLRTHSYQRVLLSAVMALAIIAAPHAARSESTSKPRAKQKNTIITLRDGIIVYSAPGQNYRPLAVLPDKAVLIASSKVVKGKRGDFYKVLVTLSPKQRAIGYIPTTAEVRLNSSVETIDSDELEKFGPIALVNKAVQISYSRFINSEYELSIGYMKYLSPGFYIKGLAGDFVSINSSGSLAGFEIGNDALLFNNISAQLSYSAGFFLPSQSGGVFVGSKSVNGFAQGIVALRYNLHGVASASLGGTQIVLLNANNSYVTYGANLTLEIGL